MKVQTEHVVVLRLTKKIEAHDLKDAVDGANVIGLRQLITTKPGVEVQDFAVQTAGVYSLEKTPEL